MNVSSIINNIDHCLVELGDKPLNTTEIFAIGGVLVLFYDIMTPKELAKEVIILIPRLSNNLFYYALAGILNEAKNA